MIKKHLTILVPYYKQPLMLRRQIEEWWKYNVAYKDNLTIIVVDDGSPLKAAHHVLCDAVLPDLDIRLYQIKENIPWNTPGVFNLGFSEAPDGWVLLNGIDHLLPADEFEKVMRDGVLGGGLDPAYAYRPARAKVKPDGSLDQYKPPYGILFIQRAVFWQVGGYDEDFSGCYGSNSSLFQKSLQKHAPIINKEEYHMWYFNRAMIEDASVTDWGRKESKRAVALNEALTDKIKKTKKVGYKPKNYLRFTWNRTF